MPLTGREIVTSRSYTTDSQGRATGTRVWRTETTSRAEATNWLTTQGISLGSVHPDASGIFLDSFSFTPEADGTYSITGNYSANGLYLLENVNKRNNPGAPYYRFQFSTYDYTIDTPYAVKEKRSVSAPGATTPTVVEAWTPYIQKIAKCDLVLTIEVRPNKLDAAAATLIASQANSLHKFASQSDYWLFISGNVQPVSDTQDLVTYTWRRDRGDNGWVSAINPTVPNASLNLYDNQSGTVLFPDLSRPAFFQWKMKMGANGPTDTPSFFKICPYTRNDSGYTTLPGINVVPSL